MNVLWAGSQHNELRRRLVEWTSREIWPDKPNKVLPDNSVAMGVFEGEELAACVVFHDWERDAGLIEMSSAAVNRRWLMRNVLDEMFRYAFHTVGAQMAVTRVSAKNEQKHLHRIFRAYGFKELRIPRLYGRDEDGILFMLTDDDWTESKFYRKPTA